MCFPRNTIALILLAGVAFAAGIARAQSYPSKPVRWIVPSAASGAFDNATRALAPVLSSQMGQPLVVENRGGSAGVAGMEQAAHAAPDGYTLLTAGGSQMVFNKYFYPKLPYDPTRDFVPITLIADLPIALWIHASVAPRSMKELVAYAKANPGKLNYGTAGVGHIFHLMTETFAQQAGIDLVHVPYKGIAPAMLEFAAGRIQLIFSATSANINSLAKAGKAFAVAGGVDKRMQHLPDVPSFAELGYTNMDAPNWIGLVAPAGLAPEIVMRWNRETVKALASPEVIKIYEAQSYQPMATSPEQFAKQLAHEHAVWGPFIRKLGITLE
jgi:tripartite-type tricarboxylate transporter receptor subunit TctC